MALLNSQPLQDIKDEMYGQMTRLLDPIALSVGPEEEDDITSLPVINVRETDTEVMLYIEITGVNIKDLDIKVSEEAVFVKGKRRAEPRQGFSGEIRSRFPYGQFQQVIALPAVIQNGEIQIDVCEGVLCLRLPKAESVRHQVVTVTVPILSQLNPILSAHHL